MPNNADLIKDILSETFSGVVFEGRTDGMDRCSYRMKKGNKEYILSVHGSLINANCDKKSFIQMFNESGTIKSLLANPGSVVVYRSD